MAKTALKKDATKTEGKAGAKATAKKAKPKKAKKILAQDATPNLPKACKVANCKREYKAKGYCKAHYKKWRQGAFGKSRYKTCQDMECRKPMAMNRFGFCEDHFQNYYVKGIKVAKAEAPAAEKPAAKAAEAS